MIRFTPVVVTVAVSGAIAVFLISLLVRPHLDEIKGGGALWG